MKSVKSLVGSSNPIVIPLYATVLTIVFLFVNPFPLLVSPFEVTHTLSIVIWLKALFATFLHANFNHLFGNLLCLVLLGYPLERKMGWRKTFALLLFALAGSSFAHVAYAPDSFMPFLGASGVASGVVACSLLDY